MNRWCLSSFLKLSRDVALRISAGREFQRVGSATQKALSPKVCNFVLRMERNPEFENCSLLSGV